MPKATQVATTEIIGQGTVLEFSTDGGTTYDQLLGVQSVPQIGTEGTFFEVQDISELVKRFQRGLQTPPEWAFAFARIGNNALQDTIIAKANDFSDNTPIKVKATYTSGDVADFDLVLNGCYSEEISQGDNLLMFAVKGQQSGSVAWSKVA